MASKCNEVFSCHKPYDHGVVMRCLGDGLCSHHQGRDSDRNIRLQRHFDTANSPKRRHCIMTYTSKETQF